MRATPTGSSTAVSARDLRVLLRTPDQCVGERGPRPPAPRAPLFRRDSIVAVLYEEQPVKLALAAPGMPCDEFVHVLDGALILTDAAGQAHEFRKGDSLLIPKGFTGTWETRANFREFALVARKDWDATH